jgi:hypothetical protein
MFFALSFEEIINSKKIEACEQIVQSSGIFRTQKYKNNRTGHTTLSISDALLTVTGYLTS